MSILRVKRSRVLIISDIHIPYEDYRAIELLWHFIDIYHPDRIIIAGDLIDFYKASKFLLHPDYGQTIKNEISQARQFLQKLREKVPNITIDFIEGNHDFRLQKYLLSLTPELINLEVLELPHLLNLSELRINWHPVKQYATSFVDNWITIGDPSINIGHFNKALQGSGMTVRNLMLQRGGNFVQGHTHRAGLIWRRGINNELYFGVENPCLYDLNKASYISDPDWAVGWTTITEGRPELIIIKNNSFCWGGKIYKS